MQGRELRSGLGVGADTRPGAQGGSRESLWALGPGGKRTEPRRHSPEGPNRDGGRKW